MAEQPQNPEPRATIHERTETVRLRRAPKYGVFIGLGAALGILAAMILTFVYDGTAGPTASGVQYSQSQVFGFLVLIGVTVGVVLGGLVALVFDRVLGRRAHDVTVDYQRTRLDDPPS